MSDKTEAILVINSGSSSIKFQIFAKEHSLDLLAQGSVSDLGSCPFFNCLKVTKKINQSAEKIELSPDYTHEQALHFIVQSLEKEPCWQITVVVHRIVHGGDKFSSSIIITPEVITYLEELCPLAPLHQQHNLSAIDIISAIKPDATQIACFDTAFHATHEPLFTEYALPNRLRSKGIRRYGFHGLSYEWIAYFLRQNEPELAQGRIIAAHLGNGASLCAMHDGISIDTTMGMTALDGLPMGTRCGTLDPGAVLYMIRELKLSVDEAESILYHQSGLLGLSDLTNDVRILQESNTPKARFALDYFCMRTAQLAGTMAVALGGIDSLVFTGGIGEHSLFIRDKILHYLDFLKPFALRVIPANEERMMAIHALSILDDSQKIPLKS